MFYAQIAKMSLYNFYEIHELCKKQHEFQNQIDSTYQRLNTLLDLFAWTPENDRESFNTLNMLATRQTFLMQYSIKQHGSISRVIKNRLEKKTDNSVIDQDSLPDLD